MDYLEGAKLHNILAYLGMCFNGSMFGVSVHIWIADTACDLMGCGTKMLKPFSFFWGGGSLISDVTLL